MKISRKTWTWLMVLALVFTGLIALAGVIDIPGVSTVVHPIERGTGTKCAEGDLNACRKLCPELAKVSDLRCGQAVARGFRSDSNGGGGGGSTGGGSPTSKPPPSSSDGGGDGSPGPTGPPGPPGTPGQPGPPAPPPPPPPPPPQPPDPLKPITRLVCHLNPLGIRICVHVQVNG